MIAVYYRCLLFYHLTENKIYRMLLYKFKLFAYSISIWKGIVRFCKVSSNSGTTLNEKVLLQQNTEKKLS